MFFFSAWTVHISDVVNLSKSHPGMVNLSKSHPDMVNFSNSHPGIATEFTKVKLAAHETKLDSIFMAIASADEQ